jgi:hypothetical protein
VRYRCARRAAEKCHPYTSFRREARKNCSDEIWRGARGDPQPPREGAPPARAAVQRSRAAAMEPRRGRHPPICAARWAWGSTRHAYELAEPHKLLALQGHEARYAHADPAPEGATMTTRALATILVLSLLAVPLAAEAQPAEKVYRIGFLSGTAATVAGPLMYFRQGLP